MKKFLPYVFVVIALVFGAYGGKQFSKKRYKQKHKKRLKSTELGRNEIDPATGRPYVVFEDKSMVVIIPSYNNEKWVTKNLNSVVEQAYSNYRVIYIDDCSSDRTPEIVRDFISKSEYGNKITYVRNKTRQGALGNLYRAIHSCRDNEVIVTLDGDDFFAHQFVLDKLNKCYANPNVWLTYGQYLDYPNFTNGMCDVINKTALEKRGFRKHEWVSSHLRTFYAGLFKKIKLQDMIHQGKFFEMAWDYAFMMPMLEMTEDRFMFIREPVYLYNRLNPISDDRVNVKLQHATGLHIRNMTPYKPLRAAPNKKEVAAQYAADLVVFSFDRPMQLYSCLESLDKYVSGINHTRVIYRCSNDEYKENYALVKEKFPAVEFILESEKPKMDFQSLVLKSIFSFGRRSSDHVLFAVDDNIVKDYVNLTECIAAMEDTQAYGFYLKMGNHVDYCYSEDSYQGVPKLNPIVGNIFAWQFSQGNADWDYPNTVDMTIYRKKDLQNIFEEITFKSPNQLEAKWATYANHAEVGLCYNTSKIINTPLNMVNEHETANRHAGIATAEDLLAKFKDGLKINITPLHQIENHSVHIEYTPEFVQR